VSDYKLSQDADNDLTQIYTYSFTEFGENQADTYFESLEECLLKLAENSGMGMDISMLRKGYRRFNHNQHAIFYKPTKTGIFVVRILGPGMSAERNL